MLKSAATNDDFRTDDTTRHRHISFVGQRVDFSSRPRSSSELHTGYDTSPHSKLLLFSRDPRHAGCRTPRRKLPTSCIEPQLSLCQVSLLSGAICSSGRKVLGAHLERSTDALYTMNAGPSGLSSTSSLSTSFSNRGTQALRQAHLPWSRRPPILLHYVATALRCSLESNVELTAPAIRKLTTGRDIPRLRHARQKGVAVNVVPNLAEASPDIEDGQEERIAENADISSINEWELDFCSRPILDARGKKVWELVVCDSKRQLQFARFYPNNVINSVTLRDALVYIMETLGVPKPEKIRFFRSQMQTIITKACKELDIQPVPSQRCITLVRWLEERYETIYSKHPGFQEGATPFSLQEQVLPLDLPDTLRGEEWAFVQLPFSSVFTTPIQTGFRLGVLEELEGVEKGSVFGRVLDLDTLKIDMYPDVMIPGVAVASSRATPLAAWTNALEIASIEVDTPRSCLILSTGVAERWRYAFYGKSRQADAEGEAWEAAKKKCGGLHFLAVQQSLDSELCTGFWLLIDVPRSPV